MKKSIISLFVGLLGFGMFTTSCEDMLTPDLDRYATQFSGKDTVNFYVGMLANLQQVIEQNVVLGELRGDLVSTTEYVTDSINEITNFLSPENGDNQLLNRAAYYKVINQCNFYLDRVDTLSMRNNYYYMRKETAQVLLIRAWTYMQLVQNYGRVPFITKPVTTSTTGWESNPEGWADADNLLSLLKKDMDQAWLYCETQGYPNYSNTDQFNTGAVKIDHRLMNFDADVVYGDLYLLCGKTQADFEQAAEHYFNFLYKNERTKNWVTGMATITRDNRTATPTYTVRNTGWDGDADNVSYSFGRNEVVTAIPSAANYSFGQTLTRLPNIFGFDVHSGNVTITETTTENGEEKETTTTSGNVSLAMNYRVRQVAPSESYVALNKSQVILYRDMDNAGDDGLPTDVAYPEGKADARLLRTAPLVRTEEGSMRFISKFGGMSSSAGDDNELTYAYFRFRYMIPVYRFRTIMLRYAEAMNRAGYPAHAFAIIRNGLAPSTYPKIETSIIDTTFIDTDSAVIRYTDRISPISDDGPNYIPTEELVRAKQYIWASGYEDYGSYYHIGVHQAGCGSINGLSKLDSIYTYEYQVERVLAEEAVRTGKTLEAPLHRTVKAKEDGEGEEEEEGEGGVIDLSQYRVGAVYEPLPAPTAEEAAASQLAVELLLVDEYALECAFEGHRYHDLMRIARRLDNVMGGNYGTEWLAWKIANRNPEQFNNALYQYLQNKDNWYMQNPKY